jgi:inosose dehydratase
MSKIVSRRQVIQRFGAAALSAPLLNQAARLSQLLGRNSTIRFGYASITWEGRDEQAIADIAALGFRGIQLRSNVVAKYADRPGLLHDLLQRRGLELVALSSGNLSIDSRVEEDQLKLHTRHAEFLRSLGGSYLQIIDQRPPGRATTEADHVRLGQLLTELGRRTADIGVAVGYHHHMGSIGEHPTAIRAILDSANPTYVKLALDTAHYRQGGGDPAQAVKDYADRLLYLHIKDVESPAPHEPSASYQFVELGRGKVDFKGFFDALRQVAFNGWAIVELDRVTDPSRTPRQAALANKRYIEEVLKLKV